MPVIRIKYLFLTISMFFFFGTVRDASCVKSISHYIDQASVSYLNINMHSAPRSHPVFNKLNCNIRFSLCCLKVSCYVLMSLSLFALLVATSGDIHPNPGPSASSYFTNETVSDMSSYLLSSHNLSLVHYNVQSLLPKVDILTAELTSFDILTFSETWLSNLVSNDQISIPGYCQPIRLDREHNSCGGVAVYIKEYLLLSQARPRNCYC